MLCCKMARMARKHLAENLPAPPPKPRRKHRKARDNWIGCKCPQGSRFTTIRVNAGKNITRRWSCIASTPQGARYVRAVCDGDDVSSPHREPDPKLKAPQQTMLLHEDSDSSSPKKRKKKLDWSKCGCPDGAILKTTKRGKKCMRGKKFVAATCSTD